MRKLLAAFLVAALSLLSFTAPAQADEGSYPEELIGEIVVAGKAPNDPQYVLTGSTLTFDLDIEFEPGDELDCSWFLARGEDEFTELHSCLDPLTVDESMVGGIVFVEGVLTNPAYEDVLVYGEMFQEVRLPADSIKLDVRVPEQLRVDELGSYEITASTTSNNPSMEALRYWINIMHGNQWLDNFQDGKFNYSPSYETAGSRLTMTTAILSDNYDSIFSEMDLGIVYRSLGAVTNPEIKIQYGNHEVNISKYPTINGQSACDLRVCTYEWLVDGKVSTKSRDEHIFKVLPEHFGREIQLRIRVAADGYEEAEVTSQKIVYPKESIPYFGIPAISGDMTVGTTVTATRMWTNVPGAKFHYQWFVGDYTWGERAAVKGGTTSTLKITPELAGRVISVDVTMSHPYYMSDTRTSEGFRVESIKAKLVKRPRITGNPVVGQKVNFTFARWDIPTVPTGNADYFWYLSGKQIRDDFPLLLTADMVGKKLVIEGSGSVAGYGPLVASSKSVTIGKSTASVKAKLSKKSIKANGASKLAVTVKAPGVAKPTGKVTVKVGKKTYKATLKASQKGKVSLTLKGLKVGKGQAVKVKFTPTGKTAKSVKSSKNTTVAKITVKKVSKTVAR